MHEDEFAEHHPLQHRRTCWHASVLLIIGGFLDEGPRKVLWTVFIVIILVAIQFAKRGDWIVRAGHFAERHGLIIIIALGEIVVAIGISVVESLDDADGLPNETLVGLIAAGVMAGLLWWSYFDRVQPALEHRAEELDSKKRAHLAGDAYTLTHVLLVGGIIATASATEEILLHPKDAVHTEFLVMFVAGFALFFGGIAIAAFLAYRVIAKERLAAVAAVAVMAYLGRNWDGIILLVVVDLVLLASLAAEHVRIESPRDEATADEAVTTSA